jgi:hypothetical protein
MKKVIIFVLLFLVTFACSRRIINIDKLDSLKGDYSQIDSTIMSCIRDRVCIIGFDNGLWKNDSLGCLKYRSYSSYLFSSLRVRKQENPIRVYYPDLTKQEMLEFLGNPDYYLIDDDYSILVYVLDCKNGVAVSPGNLFFVFDKKNALLCSIEKIIP